MKKVYFAIKFHTNCNNRALIEKLTLSIENAGFKTIHISRDYENWGKIKFSAKKLMKQSFKMIDESDLLVLDLSEKGAGLGIEAGYAHAKGIPIIVIAKKGSDISNTLRGIAKKVIFYSNPLEVGKLIKSVY